MLWNPPSHHGPSCLGTLRPQILWAHLQHPHPQSLTWFLPLLCLLVGFLYDAEAITIYGGNTCIGAHCYHLGFIVITIVSVVGFGLDVWLAIRTKALYTRIYTSWKSKKSMAVSNGH
ncbi:major facilitator superfamily protein [Artemisia annua]|uniref:Major facilitator superfamily protein n=1 Tax=Artemisia annua TaxID=35608 RepID=A0A2U1PUU4_ARTAN|nr:major facilitator superfamily protein [Artemisia annua]